MTKSKRTDQLPVSVFDQLDNKKKWSMLGHNSSGCLLSSLCLLTAALMSLGTSKKPSKLNEVVGWHSVAVTVLHYTTSIPGPIYFPIVQTNSARREKQLWSMSQKSCQSAGNQFSPCSMSGTLRRHSIFQSSLAKDCYWELQPSTVLFRCEN